MADIDAYIQVAAANTWLTAHLVDIAAWSNNTGKQAAALIEASDHIDSLYLKGYRYTDKETQPREFPRIPDRAAQIIPYDSEINFQSIEDYSEVPQEVLDACCLEALELLRRMNTQRLEMQQQGVTSMRMGDTSFSYAPGSGQGKLLSTRAKQKLSGWITGAVEGV